MKVRFFDNKDINIVCEVSHVPFPKERIVLPDYSNDTYIVKSVTAIIEPNAEEVLVRIKVWDEEDD